MRKLRPALVATVIIMAMAIRLDTGTAPAGSTEAPSSPTSASATDDHSSESRRSAGPSADAPAPRSTDGVGSTTGSAAGPALGGSSGAAAVGADLGGATGSTTGESSSDTFSTVGPSASASSPTAAPSTAPPATTTPTTQPPSPPQAAATTTLVSPSAAEAQVLALINDERSRVGLAPLRLNGGAMTVARAWTSTMSTQTLAHNPNLVSDLAQAGVTDWRTVGENVGRGTSLEQIQATFMASPIHRANILSTQLTQLGIGVITTGADVWMTVDFLGW